ncbi:hypothetical protein HPB47_003461 [Ixodes persulcatus]|uniref:Uncharacterized protein n=1 Tax=Ixodes persulcatus TaxID=34615 RepID=A0AC60PIG0_IXOPE|nr:hypothetical protein HPB47_003461 [Ixodes persulcatus]
MRPSRRLPKVYKYHKITQTLIGTSWRFGTAGFASWLHTARGANHGAPRVASARFRTKSSITRVTVPRAMDAELRADQRTTHLSKMWGILRSLFGQRKTMNGAARVALREDISTAELAEKAAGIVFPQTSIPTLHTYAKDDTNDDAIDSPLCMAELNHALQHVYARSTPSADRISYAHLRNLPDSYENALFDEMNQIWNECKLPEAWKLSIVKPIQKPGKPPSL